MELIERLRNFEPFNEQEEKDKALMLACLAQYDNIYSRENTLTHMTASAWVTNAKRDKVLMVYHNLYDSWAWAGGHADGDRDLLAVAMREVKEETGVVHVHPISKEIFSIEALGVEPHIKRGEFVSSHVHLNVTYLLEAEETDTLSVKADENSGVAWFSLDDAVKASRESFMQAVYKKLNEKMRGYGNE